MLQSCWDFPEATLTPLLTMLNVQVASLHHCIFCTQRKERHSMGRTTTRKLGPSWTRLLRIVLCPSNQP